MLQQWQHLMSSQSLNHITLNLHIQGYYKVCQESELLTNFCSPKKRTLQTFIVKKRTPYQPLSSQKADTLVMKKRRLQIFVVKKRTPYKLF